jgi:hypothetical protein
MMMQIRSSEEGEETPHIFIPLSPIFSSPSTLASSLKHGETKEKPHADRRKTEIQPRCQHHNHTARFIPICQVHEVNGEEEKRNPISPEYFARSLALMTKQASTHTVISSMKALANDMYK